MTGSPRALFVDTRWVGAHGIGRYAREVTSRFTTDWTPLSANGSPSSPREAVRKDSREVQGQLLYSPGYSVSRVSGAQQIVTVHDLIHLRAGGLRGAAYRAYYTAVVKPVIKRAGLVFTVSETSASVLRNWIDDDRVHVVNAGIGLSEAFTVEGDAETSARPYLMYVGNLRSHKNTDVIFQSIRGLDIEVRMLVPSAEHHAARTKAHEYGVASQVQLLQGLEDPDLAALYRGAVATFMPSLIEGFGLPALESVSVGTPVLYWTGCASVAEIVGDRGVAVASSTDPQEWGNAVRQTLGAPWRVTPPEPRIFDWGRTAIIVEHHLEQLRNAGVAG